MSNIKLTFERISDSLSKKNNKKLLLALFATLLLVAAIVGIVSSHKSSYDNNDKSTSHAIIRSACSSTLYPELCFSTIASEPSLSQKVSSHINVIELSLNKTIGIVQRNYFTIEKLLTRKGLTKREKTALHDCLETIDETLDELDKAKADLKDYPSSKKSLPQQAEYLKTLISSAITNQVTCLDGFSHAAADKILRKYLEAGQVHAEHLCSNALAMTKNLTDTDMANYEKNKMVGSNNRKLMVNVKRYNKIIHVPSSTKWTVNVEIYNKTIHVPSSGISSDLPKEDGTKWPEWISAADRRLLQSGTVNPDVVVAADGSGNFRTVSAAVAAAPERSSKRYVIRIKAGVYRENVDVPSRKTNIMFLGDGRTKTIITASRNVVDGSTTFNSATVAVVGERFLARGITFQNAAGPSKHQAVALRVGGDLSAFYLCGFIAYQDTLYVHTNRQFFVNCYIAGTIDFIFGNSAVVLQNCDIHARRPNPGQKNMVTAQGRVDPNQNTGIVIQKCRIGATKDLEAVKGTFPTFLGRPWKEYSRTVIMQSTIRDVIDPAGWFEWDGDFALNTLFYGEYQNTGAGAATSKRVKWKGFKVITSATEAQSFTPGNFIAGSSWLGSTGFPFSLGL